MTLYDPSADNKVDNLAATTAPTVNDDTDLGYGVGSIWVDTTAGRAYIAEDVTDGAAVWLDIVDAD